MVYNSFKLSLESETHHFHNRWDILAACGLVSTFMSDFDGVHEIHPDNQLHDLFLTHESEIGQNIEWRTAEALQFIWEGICELKRITPS